MKKKEVQYTFFNVCFIFLFLVCVRCGCPGNVDDRLDLAEIIMESHPDSAYNILDGIDSSDLISKKLKARHALLKSMALDKNYIDTTSFEVLQPAIDYYLQKGNANERLRTHYYQGRIYENAGTYDLAMESYLQGLKYSNQTSDSLTLARLLVAQGSIYYRLYKIKDFVANNLRSADIFGHLNLISSQLRCYNRALNGEVILRNNVKADSIYEVCEVILDNNSQFRDMFLRYFLMYTNQFGSEDDARHQLEKVKTAGVTDAMKMNIARAYTKIGEYELGLRYLEEATIKTDDVFDSLTYWAVKAEILEKMGNDGDALEAFRNYSRLLETYHTSLFSNELLFSEKKHEMEMDNMAELRKRDSIIIWILAATGCLLIITVFVYYRYRLNKAGRRLAESNAQNLQLENDRQRLLAENLEAERAQLSLEAENLYLQINQLEAEKERLENLLDRKDTLSGEARELVRERISMLNGLIAQALTEHDSYGKEFKNYIAKIKRDKKGFQRSLVKVMETTHPDFIAYLQDHGLTERELHYCCLYAIGLRGKEIGSYLDLARHYNVSTDIRRKLGLDTNSENLGTFLHEQLSRQ